MCFYISTLEPQNNPTIKPQNNTANILFCILLCTHSELISSLCTYQEGTIKTHMFHHTFPFYTAEKPQRFIIATLVRGIRWSIYLFICLGFQHCTGHITTGSWKGRGNQYIQFVRVLYCKRPTNGKQLPAFPFEAVSGIEPRP